MNMVELIKALSSFAWPILGAVVFCLLYPALRELVRSRAFTLKVGDMELTVQQGLDGVKADISDLRQQVISIQDQLAVPKAFAGAYPSPAATTGSASATPPKVIRRILWVDDKPQNNAYYVAALKEKRVDTELALSTQEALLKLRLSSFDAIISDMARNEDGKWDYEAGLTLLRKIKEMGLNLPFFLFTATATAGFARNAVAAGAKTMTSSSTELFRALRENGAPV